MMCRYDYIRGAALPAGSDRDSSRTMQPSEAQMPPVDIVGKVGRALTEVGSTGRVEVGGAVYDALTTRTPIPAGELVEVTGWRLIGESSHVLHVRRPGDDSPVGPDARDGRSADAKLFVKRDWERIAAECFVAVIASAGLLALAHLYRP